MILNYPGGSNVVTRVRVIIRRRPEIRERGAVNVKMVNNL